MAQGVAEFTAPSRAEAEKASHASAPVARAIPLDLAPLLAPYRRHGRFSIRVENLPQGARLTAGRNNGDRTWSLASDELDELFYVPPGNMADHLLALRLVGREDAGTLALIELPVRAGQLVAHPPRTKPAKADAREREISLLKAQLTEQKRTAENELAAARKMLEAQGALDAKAREQAAELLRQLTRRCDEAEAGLIRQRQESEAEIAAARKTLEAQGVLERDKEGEADRALAELTARCHAAEAELARQRQALEAEMAAARDAAEAEGTLAAEREREATQALAELQARCEAAESALRSAQETREKRVVDDVYVLGLNREIKTLQAILVDREAAIARAEASLEQMQLGTVAKPPPAHWEPLPGGLSHGHKEDGAKKSHDHLARDFVLVFGLVGLASLGYFFTPSLLAAANWQWPNLANLFGANEEVQDIAQPAQAPLPKPDHPRALVVRDVNLRAAPSTNGAVIGSLKQGSAVTVLDRQGDWDRVEIVIPGRASRQGWTYDRYIGQAPQNSAPAPGARR